MNKEFHYWITGLLSHKAGFSEEQVKLIAYCSQYVDDNDQILDVYPDEFDPTPSYRNNVSQTMNPTLPHTDQLRIYPIFHFIPGDQTMAVLRKDQKKHLLNTTPGSPNAMAIMNRAVELFKSGALLGIYRLSIAAHAFVDTWAHQNFAGCRDDFNAMANIALPNIGHADAIHHPDWVAHRWTDDRLEQPEIDNTARYLGASMALYASFRAALGQQVQPVEWQNLEALLLSIWQGTYSGDSETGVEERITQYQKHVPYLPDYDDRMLQESALVTYNLPVPGSDDYANRIMWKSGVDYTVSPWYLFQEAVKDHLTETTAVLQPVFSALSIDA